jgi:NADH:ubiquinone oxidoreductase subunit C
MEKMLGENSEAVHASNCFQLEDEEDEEEEEEKKKRASAVYHILSSEEIRMRVPVQVPRVRIASIPSARGMTSVLGNLM